MGIELDVLVGHPEYDLLFIATQVAKASGLKNPSGSVAYFAATKHCPTTIRIGEIATCNDLVGCIPPSSNGCAFVNRTILMDEPSVYQMLLRGHAPKSEPFRKWVTEEVLPTIRKTGKYDAEQSSNPIAMGLMVP
ncbi:hypothetical protein C4E44_00570 [Pseudomonas sp. MWU12-2312b]|nr:hypothetical protein C4E44_00570 [Pseudomonas sp. MWU12-2312b]